MDPLYGGASMDSGSPIYSIAVPTHLLADREVSATAKLLYGVIDSFQRKSGVCYASNERLAEEIAGCSARTISRALSELKNGGYIEIDDAKGRKIYLSTSTAGVRMGRQKCLPPTTEMSTLHDKIGGGGRHFCLPSNTTSNSESKSEKKTIDPLPLFVEWIQVNLGSHPANAKNHLYSLLVEYKGMRADSSSPLNTRRKVNGLLSDLLDGSGGDIFVMCDMVTTATRRCWLAVYPPGGKKNNKPEREERQYECL